MARLRDTVKLVSVEGLGEIDRFTSIMISHDLSQNTPTEAAIELGDDGTYPSIQEIIQNGKYYKVYVNGQLNITGRIESQDVPTDSSGGSVTRFTIRTKLADAMFCTADPLTRVRNTSVKDFILELYHPLGITEEDFLFDASVARDLMTGRTSSRGKAPVNLDPIKIDAAKVNPPEAVFDAADRHLRRHGFMHWDSPDGRIVVGQPEDSELPMYFLQYTKGGNSQYNNVLSATRTQDLSGIPSAVVVYGLNGTKGKAKNRIVALAKDSDVYDAGFYRPIVVQTDSIRTQALADKAALRELSARSKNKDNFVIETDGLSYWDGRDLINWGIDTVCTVDADVANISKGAYFIHRVILTRDAQDGDRTNLVALRRGIWKL
jgi:prophage tail gpP-like protein